MKESYFQIESGYFKRRWWDNVFCTFCGNELAPEESYGDSTDIGICDECIKILLKRFVNV
jgi:hypothetical protein